MKILFRHTRVFTFLLTLLLLGGVANQSWAVKYHILTKPFSVRNHNDTDNKWANIRVEALLCESSESTIGLPDQFKSPLATNFQYWGSATSTYANLYDYSNNSNLINAKYYIYQCTPGDPNACLSDPLTPGASVGSYTDIYVTYDYINDGKPAGYRNEKLELDGGTEYNIGFMNGVEKFMCLNRSRNNRVSNANGSVLTGEQLADNDFVVPENGKKELGWPWGSGDNKIWGPKGIQLGFKFLGLDPYNLTIMTSYLGQEVHVTDAISGDPVKAATTRPYKGATLFGKMGNDQMWFDASNDRHYLIKSGMTNSDVDLSTGNYKNLAKYETCKNTYNNADVTAQYEKWVGYYRKEHYAEVNTYAVLPHPTDAGSYLFVASKMNMGDNNSKNPTINQPNSSKQYFLYNDNGETNKPSFTKKALSSAYVTNFYEIRTYTIHVTTPLSSQDLTATLRWSDARLDDNPADHVPEALKRKYCSYTAYSDAAHNNPVTTFRQILAANPDNYHANMHIYLDYTVSESMPFKTLPAGGSYQDAQWYTMRMDGVANPKYVAYNDGSSNVVVTNGSGAAKGSNTASQIHQGENSAEAMVAFIGDPYELKILNRKACEDAPGNRFIGCATGSTVETTGLTTDKTGTSDISTWEIVYESIGEEGMLLRQFNTAADPKYIGLGDATSNKPVTYSATSSRIRVVELDKKKYAFHIIRIDGSMAVMATSSEEVGRALKGDYTDIPEIIRSPYLSTATVNFYTTQADAEANNDPSKRISHLPYDPDGLKDGIYANIYVRYSFTSAPAAATYNVRVNNDYIYTSENAIKSKANITDTERDNDAYRWIFNFSDPYALTIYNVQLGSTNYVNVSFSDQESINWSPTPSYFIAKSGNIPGTYEVMAATGNEIDASTEYYNIGRPAANNVKLYNQNSYKAGNATLRFQLSATSASDVTYHLVDMYNNVLLQAKTRQSLTEDLPAFPPEYYSPLVSKYYYHKTLEHAIANRTSNEYVGSETVGQGNVYVTYDVNDLVDLKAGQLYLMKYEAGENFRQENGSDDLQPEVADMSENTYKYQAVYPYCNGDGNFFVYGQEQYDLQQEGASSTRTRWAWYVESNVPGATKGDPYHVTIKSRQTESYPITNSSEYNAYFMTYKPDDYEHVITTLGWPGMNSETATEYMVLGSEGQYQLVTTNEIGGSRYIVDSFEQYWKTFDTIKKKIYGSSKEDDNDPIIIPEDVTKETKTLRNYLKENLGWHNYEKWAYAKRWNGYNNGYSSEVGTHETKKGWEKIEHWYQTVDMGEGYFDFVKTSIDPVLILLDQHGWEIMRKPLPAGPDDPEKEAKYAAIRPYNSPMVKEYAFWSTAKKRTGFHQYYQLKDRIGDGFTSTDLTNLPPYGSANVLDKKGNQNDQYVTYIVKDEYAQTYNPENKSAKPFLIEQGTDHKYATTNDEGTTLTASVIPSPYTDNMKAYILNGTIQDTEKWYVKPNDRIDDEMGYSDTSISHDWKENKSGYELDSYKNKLVAEYIDDKTLGQFSFSNGFDPYNIQISSVKDGTKYMKTNASGAELHEGSIIGSYSTNPGTIAMGDNTGTISPNPKWYDSRNLYVTNATFMAVQDAAGNMQLMPRFDHSTRMSEFGTLIAPTDAQVATTYTKLYRPEIYEYLIIDNDGNESLRYKAGGDMTPQTPNHFQSPLAKNFTYYATASYDSGTGKYSDITNKIESSLDGATLTDKKVYVRYEYDEENDSYHMLKGNWLTMQLDKKNTIYNNGIKQGGSKPSPVDEAWQWKFLETPQSTPDPYAIYIYNRSQTAGTKAVADRFALLSHSEGDYALAKAGRGDYDYYFLNGSGMNETTAATIAEESDFTPTAGTFDGTKSQIKLTDDVQHTFIYKVYTNGGVNAIDANQTQEDVHYNSWKPVLPEAAHTPLLNMDQYRYYEQDLSVATPDTTGKSLTNLYGLYDDVVYTRYTAYNPDLSNYLVPNVRNDKDGVDPVAPGIGSNDAPVGLDGKRPYNIIWYADNMMQSNGTSIENGGEQDLQATPAMEWEFEGDDPYAIKIKSVGESGKYIHKASDTTTELSTDATTFMLLNKDGFNYGVFTVTGSAVTDETPVMLSGYGNELTTSDPIHFIPFALSTFKVVYHLMIKNIGDNVLIPYREKSEDAIVENYPIKGGTTLRDLEKKGSGDGHIDGDYYQLGSTINDKTYCFDAGHISLGDAFEVPQAFYRPNVSYDFYIDGVYNHDSGDYSGTPNTEMNSLYRGLKMTNLGDDSRLLGKIVWVNIVYNFMGGLDTNSGSDFVESVSQNKWYTFETNDATPMLAEYSGSLKTKSGYATHYTNDYLWTPVGDPYGFKMYNRYMYKNLGEKKVMSTTDFDRDQSIEMVADNAETPYVPHKPANSVYELLSTSTTTSGYFRIHPVVNKDGTQFYMNNNSSTGAMTLSTTATEWTFGLSEDVMRPYFQAAGYVGGLNEAGKAAYKIAAAKTNPLERLMELQDVVYNHDKADNDEDNYIVHYAPGYYRLHSQPGSSDITTPRYASGYTHEIEKTAGAGSTAIPLHFYEVEEYSMKNPTFRDLESGEYTISDATQGDIPLVTVANDPASIFHFSGAAGANPTSTISTQGLNVIGNRMGTGEGTVFKIIDIGAGVVALQSGDYFLNYNQNNTKYDLKYSTADALNAASALESTRWCMRPVQKAATAKDGEMPLTVTTKNGGDDYYYTTFYAPFDALLTSTNDVAYVIPTGGWPSMYTGTDEYSLNPKNIGEVNGRTDDDKNQFIPAGTPVIIRTKNTSGNVTMALPNATPSSAITTVLSGTNLEQMLPQGTDYVFVFGRSYTHSDEFSYIEDPSNEHAGEVTPKGLEFDKGVGFYKNANTNRESNATKTLWSRNNKYVYGNKVYYRGSISSSSGTRSIEFIPVLFEAEATDVQGVKDYSEGMLRPGNVYNLQGRCVATEEMVKDGTWKNNLTPGVYIMSGKKIIVK